MSRLQQTYQLIKALTRGEKRFFNLFANKYDKKGKNNIIQLFNIYDSNAEWNEKQIDEKIKKEKLDKYTAVLNNKLLDNLITSLRLQSNETNVDFNINKYFEEAKILFQREIYDLALDRIKKAKKLARAVEKNEKLLEICNVEKFISVRVLSNVVFKEFRTKLYEEKQELLRKIQNKEAYWQLSDEIFFLYRKIGRPSSDKEIKLFNDVIENPLLQDVEKAISTSAKSSFYFVYTIYYLSIQDHHNALKVIDKQLKCIQSNPQYLIANIDQCVAVMNNSLYIHSELNDGEALFKTILKMRALPEEHSLNSTYFNRRIFETTYSMELDYYIKNLKVEEARNILPHIIKELKKYGKAGWSLDRFLSMAFGISLVYYYLGDVGEAHKWIDNILERENEKSNIQILAFAKILDLILHFQLKNKSLLLYRSKSVKRFLKKTNRLHKIDEAFIKLLHQLSANKERSDSVNKFMDFFKNCPPSYTKMYYSNYIQIESLCFSILNNELFRPRLST